MKMVLIPAPIRLTARRLVDAVICFRSVFVLFLLVILVCTGNGQNQQSTPSGDLDKCSAVEPTDLTESMRWRLRAYNNIDCIKGKLEQAMNRSTDSKDEVKLSREEVEQLLNIASLAKDAAQRIGR
jgi:hypothetical protein